MDQFPDGHHLWLRSREHGTYLHADEDGHGVSLSRRRASMNAAWAVHRNYGDDQHVLLYSAAYGRYLVATDALAPLGCGGLRVEQRNYDEELEEDAIRWQALTNGSGDYILLRNAAYTAYSRYHRYGYLRANGGLLGWNEGVVSLDDFNDICIEMQWVVVPIPSTELVPRLTRPNNVHLHLAESLATLLPSREVVLMGLGIMRFVRDDLVMYVRAGTDGRFTPLVVDLPRSSQTLAITVGPPAPGERP
ncbi:unnamed protein product [Alopecurus aequalis]